MKLLDERTLTTTVARVTPWLAPVPTAYLTATRTTEHLAWPTAISAVAGLIVEGVGLAAVNTALEFREHNRGLKDGDRRTAPFVLAAVAVVVYYTSVIGLTVILDTVPQVARYAPLAFPALGGIGTLLIAMRRDHAQRVEEMILSRAPPYNKTKHRLLRAALLAELRGEVAQPAPQEPRPAHEPETPAQRNGHGRSFEQFERAVARGTLDLAEMTGEQVGEWAGKSASTGRRWRRRALMGGDGRAYEGE